MNQSLTITTLYSEWHLKPRSWNQTSALTNTDWSNHIIWCSLIFPALPPAEDIICSQTRQVSIPFAVVPVEWPRSLGYAQAVQAKQENRQGTMFSSVLRKPSTPQCSSSKDRTLHTLKLLENFTTKITFLLYVLHIKIMPQDMTSRGAKLRAQLCRSRAGGQAPLTAPDFR